MEQLYICQTKAFIVEKFNWKANIEEMDACNSCIHKSKGSKLPKNRMEQSNDVRSPEISSLWHWVCMRSTITAATEIIFYIENIDLYMKRDQ